MLELALAACSTGEGSGWETPIVAGDGAADSASGGLYASHFHCFVRNFHCFMCLFPRASQVRSREGPG